MMMRTTVTLDADVAAKVKAEMRRSGASFKEVVNKLLRMGAASMQKAPLLEPFVIKVRPLGLRPGLDYDRISELIEQLEGPFET